MNLLECRESRPIYTTRVVYLILQSFRSRFRVELTPLFLFRVSCSFSCVWWIKIKFRHGMIQQFPQNQNPTNAVLWLSNGFQSSWRCNSWWRCRRGGFLLRKRSDWSSEFTICQRGCWIKEVCHCLNACMTILCFRLSSSHEQMH